VTRLPLVQRLSWRGGALLFFALVGLVYGAALATAPRPLADSYVWASKVLPLPAWAVMWTVAGLVCLVCALLHRDAAAFVVFAFVSAWWGLLSAVGWVWGGVERGFLNAAIFIPMAGLMYVLAAGLKPKVTPS
jgi:hypothetical protein